MNIDKDVINQCVIKVIDGEVGTPWEYAEQDDTADHQRVMTLGFMAGVLTLGRELKKRYAD